MNYNEKRSWYWQLRILVKGRRWICILTVRLVEEIMIKGLLQCLSSYESAAQPGTSVQSPMCVKAIDKCIIYPLSNPKTASSIDYDQQVSIISSSFSRLSILFECSHNLNNCTDDEKKRNRKGKDIVVTQNYCFSSKCVRECFK